MYYTHLHVLDVCLHTFSFVLEIEIRDLVFQLIRICHRLRIMLRFVKNAQLFFMINDRRIRLLTRLLN